jgi:hypothetical protein
MFLLLKERYLPEIGKYILYLREKIIENEIKSINQFPNLIRFYLNFDVKDKVELFVEDRKIRKTIHEFCERNQLLSRSKYEVKEILERECWCGKWSNQHTNYSWVTFYCERCQESFGYASDDDIYDLIADKEVKVKYACEGSMLIMKRNNIIPNYKKSGNYRKRRGFKKYTK